MIQKATELGVTKFLPIMLADSVPEKNNLILLIYVKLVYEKY